MQVKKLSFAHSMLKIKVRKNNTKINISYTDNGIGCTLKKQNGLSNTENRIHAIHGTITFETSINNGFKATIKI